VEVNRRFVLLGLGAVGAFLAVDIGAVAYANKWIGPNNTLTRGRSSMLSALCGGPIPGSAESRKGRRCHRAFRQQRNGSELSRAAVFRPGRSSVTGRFSLSGGDPNVADTPATARGLGLSFAFPDGTQWRSAMLNLPVFPDNSAQGFYDRLLAQKIVSETGKPDPAAMPAFLAAHPESAAAMALIKQHPPTRGFADSTFSSLITFFFVNDAGVRTPVRWSFVPQQQASEPRSGGRNDLFDALIRQMRNGPLQWRLILTVGAPGDATTDATLPWRATAAPSTPSADVDWHRDR
jgi:catalase